MSFWKPSSKKAIIEWLYWFYDGKYSKYKIKQRNVRGWYFKLRHAGAVKRISRKTTEIYSKTQC